MTTYYCEVKGRLEPHFRGYKLDAETNEEAINRFKQRWGEMLELVYYEEGTEVKIIFELQGASMNFYVWTADLNSLYDDKPRKDILAAKVKTEEEAKEKVLELSTHDTAAWYTTWDSEDSNHRWDSENPCLSVSYKHED